jgi:valyl-tRNA synthetase
VTAVVVEAKAEDPGLVRARLEQEIARARSELERSRAMLANERFTAKAPPQKVDEERAKEARYAVELEELEARLRASV